MKNILFCFVLLMLFVSINQSVSAQRIIFVHPEVTDEVLLNPGIGFMTFQRFNGDSLNEGSGWTEGYPIKYQKFSGSLENKNHPMTTIAYFRVYWRFMEPEKGKYNWSMIDSALVTAHERKQTLMLRIAPYGTNEETDVPDWYRKMVGDENDWASRSPVKKWMVDPENPLYTKYFCSFIKALGMRYDGHPDLESVDLSIVGAWGEGAGSGLLEKETMEKLVSAYTDHFKKTPLIMLLSDKKTNEYGLSQANVGWRVDCLGDLGFWVTEQNKWCHMYNYYPEGIINFGMKDAWKKAPVSLEICGTFLRWKDKEGYNKKDVKYIFDQALKWHISSFNAKSSPVPEEWEELVNDWLKKMGYRFAIRNFSYPEFVSQNEKLSFQSWWENKGVAPCYKKFLPAIRLSNNKRTETFVFDTNITDWLPGDIVFDDAIFIPGDMPAGNYDIQIGIVDPQTHKPAVQLAIKGKDAEGWYTMGKIKIKKKR